MKKLLIIMCALFLFGKEGTAQWKFSAIVGPDMATFSGSEKKDWGGTGQDPKWVFRFHGGILADYLLNEKGAVTFGLMYALKGTKYSGEAYDFNSNANVAVSYTKQLAYLNIPILYNYRASEKFSFVFGPQVSFLMSAKVKNDENSQKLYEVPETEDVKDYYSKLDIGLNVGPTINLTEKLALQLLFQQGLLKIGKDQIYNNNGMLEDHTYAIMNRVVRFSIIYVITEK
jgi:hypothetical protein